MDLKLYLKHFCPFSFLDPVCLSALAMASPDLDGDGRSFKDSITVEGMCLEEAKKKRPGEEQDWVKSVV